MLIHVEPETLNVNETLAFCPSTQLLGTEWDVIRNGCRPSKKCKARKSKLIRHLEGSPV